MYLLNKIYCLNLLRMSSIPSGTFSRWSFGFIILTHLMAYNECGSVCVLVAGVFAMLNSLLMGR